VSIHLVSYATPRFRHRQWALNLSARSNPEISGSTSWSKARLLAAGFEAKVGGISLDERGSGFWAWKPFIILEALRNASAGDLVLYCDVGRSYPWKLLHTSLEPLVDWLDHAGQDVLPGVRIPWYGPMRCWTKRDAFVYTGCDEPRFHEAVPVQASFSLWKKGERSLALAEEWLTWCGQRELVSDDPNRCGLDDLDGFREHRHDQSLWTLLCVKHGLKGLDVGSDPPGFDEKNPACVAKWMGGPSIRLPVWLNRIVEVGGGLEKKFRG